ALIATELASNVLKHAGRGGAMLGVVHTRQARGVVIATWDRGPGMDFEGCLRDGMSTAGTRGVGLGAVARRASRVDAYAPRGKGSVVIAEVFRAGPPPVERFAIGAACMPYPGMTVCGDAWAGDIDGDRATLIVCDGLGHGEGAAAAAAAVIAAFRAAPGDPLPRILERADRAARPTRGAAATLARIDLSTGDVVIAGVGNVAVWIQGDALKQLVTQHGTLGQAVPAQLREERARLPPGGLIVMCSDGIRSRWSFDDHPGLVSHHPTTIATVMWRDLARGRDDASVVVTREAVTWRS
ncbi:MAG TPA: SpoIIE family protein phosphatase, partial [Kofleriaceae bacterium]|nr:SpoIIE family protein phosphatase [Kofleriaceae bacterium]